MSKQIKRISLLAVGIAMFVVLSLCLQVPVFENYYLCLGYVVMAVYCCSFGTLSGTVVGFFGVVPYEYGFNFEKNEWEIRFCRVFKTCGFTVVLDGEFKLRFIKKGYFTEDEVSLMNKGNTKDRVVSWYKRLIYEEIWLNK